jgi:UDP-GlcNAc:undecaprenyl-phosphate/decaprenyl-phosphate GlcNAc-1-phosphate transferase
VTVESRLALAVALGFAVTLATTPLAIRVAAATRSLDRPGGHKGHAAPTPYLGGTALVAGFGVGALALAEAGGRLLPVLGWAVVLCLIGTLDDRFGVPAALRLDVPCSGRPTSVSTPRRAPRWSWR